MRRAMLLVGLTLMVFVGTVALVTSARGSCSSCWNTKDCDEWEYSGGCCATYNQTDMTDLKWLDYTGYESLGWGVVYRRQWERLNGADIIDTADRNCNFITTEHICFGGGIHSTTTIDGQVTWYAGYGECQE